MVAEPVGGGQVLHPRDDAGSPATRPHLLAEARRRRPARPPASRPAQPRRQQFVVRMARHRGGPGGTGAVPPSGGRGSPRPGPRGNCARARRDGHAAVAGRRVARPSVRRNPRAAGSRRRGRDTRVEDPPGRVQGPARRTHREGVDGGRRGPPGQRVEAAAGGREPGGSRRGRRAPRGRRARTASAGPPEAVPRSARTTSKPRQAEASTVSHALLARPGTAGPVGGEQVDTPRRAAGAGRGSPPAGGRARRPGRASGARAPPRRPGAGRRPASRDPHRGRGIPRTCRRRRDRPAGPGLRSRGRSRRRRTRGAPGDTA